MSARAGGPLAAELVRRAMDDLARAHPAFPWGSPESAALTRARAALREVLWDGARPAVECDGDRTFTDLSGARP